MATKGNERPIVAELGRAETPAEAAARKAETSRKHRANQTLLNLIGATLASLAIVLFLVVVVVRPAPEPTADIDYSATAAEAQGGSSEPLVVPALPQGWSANAARFDRRFEVLTLYIGFVTPSTEFIAFNQGIEANATWQAAVLDAASPTGETTIDGVVWTIYDERTADDPGNHAYALSATVDGSTFVLHGTASDSEFEALATTISAEVD